MMMLFTVRPRPKDPKRRSDCCPLHLLITFVFRSLRSPIPGYGTSKTRRLWCISLADDYACRSQVESACIGIARRNHRSRLWVFEYSRTAHLGPREFSGQTCTDHQTCRVLHRIWMTSASLQYHFTLQTSAYLDVGPLSSVFPSPFAPEPPLVTGHDGRLSASNTVQFHGNPQGSSVRERTLRTDCRSSAVDKNRALKDRERRWETLDPAQVRSLVVQGPARVYELQEGVFLICDDYTDGDDGKVSSACGRIHSPQPRSIRLIPLPSAEDPDLEEPILPLSSNPLGFQISDLTMDPTQDLIVVSEHT